MKILRARDDSARNPMAVGLMGLLLLLGAATAHASSFALLEQSGGGLGTAFAGTGAVADNATTVFFNPAGLSHLDRMQIAVVATGININTEFHNAGSQPAFGQLLGNSGGSAGGWNLVPAVYVAAPLKDKLSVGFGVNAPFGLKLVYDDGWMGRFQAMRSEIKAYNFNPAAAYRINDRISVGLGIDYQRLQAELTNQIDYSAVIAQGIQQLVAAGQLSAAAAPGLIAANTGLEGEVRVRGDDDAWGFNVGLLFDLSDDTRLAITYRSAFAYKVEGTAQFTSPPIAQSVGASIVTAASTDGGALANGAVSLNLKVPDSAALSLRQRLNERLELLADVAWAGWSTIQELRIVRDTGTTLSVTPELWNDTWRFAVGAAYALARTVKLRGGLAYDPTPVPASTRTARLPDSDRSWAAIGAQWAAAENVILDFGYAHLFMSKAPLNQDDGNAAANGLLAGDQHSNIGIASAQLNYRF